jgi:hypothetical protein
MMKMDEEPKYRASGMGPKPPRLGSKKAGSRKALVNQHEKELAAKLGGRPQPLSGALSAFKGDVSLDDFLLDSKETENASLIISHKDLTKATREAHQSGKMPGLILTIKRVPGTIANEWILISIDDFAALLQKLEEQGNELSSFRRSRKSEETDSGS